MRRLTYYVAATLDGYIAGPDGGYDFFPFEGEVREAILAEYPETMPAHVRGPLGLTTTPHRHFDTVIMGRGTYEPALKAGITSPYAHLEQYVVSRALASPSPDVELVADDPAALVRELKKQDGMGIWLAGGGKLAAALRDEIDELIIKRNPVVIGSGVPLFDGPFAPTGFVPTARRDFDSGVSIVTYTRK
ncbi:dihydrofolate reductase family protein [Streptomyces sp. NPDC001292]|uniref:dihydrofolate reductase family protein n=1 Tax=Streptomyces sp. NPDC001292 TaxID=3364558 RepID=UPI0036AC01A6